MDPFALNLIMILCFIAGSGLIIAEAFMPGFGVAGISGVILEIVALWCTWRLHGVGTALLALLGVLVLVGLAIFISYRSALNGRLSRSHLVLKNAEKAESMPDVSRVGQEGVALTALRPAGFIQVGKDRLSASSDGTFIEKGSPVVITGVEGNQFTIRRKD